MDVHIIEYCKYYFKLHPEIKKYISGEPRFWSHTF